MRRRLWLVAVIGGLTACNSLGKNQDPTRQMVTLGTGTIEHVRRVSLGENENLGSRIAIGFLGSGIIGAIAASNVEDDFGKSNGWEYVIRMADKQSVTMQSLSVMQVGDCVLIRREGPDGVAHLTRQPEACENKP